MIPYFQALFIQRHGMISALLIYGRPLVKTVWAVHIDAFYTYVMIRATSIIPLNYKRVSGTCAFIAFTRAPGIGLKDRMHSSTY